ncbi:MAG: hypothetical protein JSR58_02025 [Verrucomicrobia bacterium]|nr:hypothetical protein [Verrucomicrobiota bacterium]
MKSNNAALLACRALLDKASPEKKEALLGHLSEMDQTALQALPETQNDPLEFSETMQDRLQRIHDSWLTAALRNFSPSDMRLFLASLAPAQATEVQKALQVKGSFPPVSDLSKQFLSKTLWERIVGKEEEPLPISCLPPSSLLPLLDISFDELSRVIEYLGMHDLATEMRQIIEAARLKKIYDVLAPEEQNYVKMLLQSQEPVVFSRMGIMNWKGDSETLRSLIVQRGINRLAKVAYGQHPSFLWYLSHRLDAPRAQIFQKLCAPLENPAIVSLLTTQVLELFSFLRRAA